MNWLVKNLKEIGDGNATAAEKFNQSQTIIATAFNEIVTQIATISKPRADILRMLWNRQNDEVESIIKMMQRQSSNLEKNSLKTVKSVHLSYQEQISQFKDENGELGRKVEEANLLNDACLNSLRVMKKQVRKYEKMLKQLIDSNNALKLESIGLLD
jgi:predicted transcriptional regulator